MLPYHSIINSGYADTGHYGRDEGLETAHSIDQRRATPLEYGLFCLGTLDEACYLQIILDLSDGGNHKLNFEMERTLFRSLPDVISPLLKP